MVFKDRKIAIDMGQNYVKSIGGHLKNRWSHPNIIAIDVPKDRGVIQYEGDIIENLHFIPNSKIIPNLSGHVIVAGDLALEYPDKKKEVTPGTIKHEDEQCLLMILLNTAIDAVRTYPVRSGGVLEVEYDLSTIIPISEIKAGAGPKLAALLRNYTHEITFLQVPGAENVTVIIKYSDKTEVNGESMVSLFDLSMPDSDGVEAKIPNIMELNVIVFDVGGGTSDAVMRYEGKLHTNGTTGENIGSNEYLDNTIARVKKEFFGYDLKNRQQIVKRIKAGDYKIKFYNRDKRQRVEESFKPILDEEMSALARRVKDDVLSPLWRKVSEIDLNIAVGGSCILIKDELKKMTPEQVFYFFEDEDDFIWSNVKGAFKMLL